MNPLLIFWILIIAIILWLLSSAIFYPLGNLIMKIWVKVVDEINKEEGVNKNE